MARILLIFSLIPLFIGAALIVWFSFQGSYVDEQGILIEPFWALGLGSVLIALAIVTIAASGLISLLKKSR